MSSFDILRSVDRDYHPIIIGSVVGLLTILVGRIAGAIIKPYFKVSLPEICKKWNDKNVMEWSLFATGFLLYVVLEYTGILSEFSQYHR